MRVNKELEAIIFDLDGTLWDAIDTFEKTFKEMKEKYDEITEEISTEQVKYSMGKTFNEVVKIYYGYLPEIKGIKYTNEALNKNVENIAIAGGKLYSNVKETIISLSKKYKLYIVSNCVEGYIESFFEATGLKSCFEDYESNGRTGLSKAENIRLVMERNGVKRAIYIGDTLKDKEAAESANIPFIHASYGFGSIEQVQYAIKDIKELLDL